MKSIIIDDKKAPREALETLLGKYCPTVEVIATANNVSEGLQIIEQQTPQLVFLDVEMPDGTGFDLLEKLGNIPFQYDRQILFLKTIFI